MQGGRADRGLAEDPAFRRRVDAIRTDLFGLAVGRLSQLAGKAADALAGLLEARNEAVRLQAAKAVLECGMRLREALDLARRVEEIEAQLGGPPRPEGPGS